MYVEKKVRSVVELISIEYLFLWSGFFMPLVSDLWSYKWNFSNHVFHLEELAKNLKNC